MAKASKTKTREAVGNSLNENGNVVSYGMIKAQMLYNFFSNVFTKENLNDIPAFENRCEGGVLSNFEITSEVIEKFIKQFNAQKSQGPDSTQSYY